MQKTQKNLRSLFLVFLWMTLVVAGFTAGMVAPVFAQADEDAGDIKGDISELESKLKRETKELESLKQDLGQINSSLTATQMLILKVQTMLEETEQTIGQKESEIANLEKQLLLERYILRGLIQEMYFRGDVPLADIVLEEDDLLRFLQGQDNLFATQEQIQTVIGNIEEIRAKVTEEKLSLENAKSDHVTLLAVKNRQKQALVLEKSGTQDDLEEQQATVAELQSKLQELKNDLNTLLGKSYNAKNIKDAIQFAASKTGVREGFLFGMLSVESRLGASVGGCDYKESRMSKYRLSIFKDIAEGIGEDYRKLKVSCPPRNYKGTGGAMGVAQFMSDTWKGYESVIAARTGNRPPNPWSLTDGVMAMASKLANDGGTKEGSTQIVSPCNGKKVSVKWETYASMRYLGWSCFALNNYSKTIQSLSGNYKNL